MWLVVIIVQFIDKNGLPQDNEQPQIHPIISKEARLLVERQPDNKNHYRRLSIKYKIAQWTCIPFKVTRSYICITTHRKVLHTTKSNSYFNWRVGDIFIITRGEWKTYTKYFPYFQRDNAGRQGGATKGTTILATLTIHLSLIIVRIDRLIVITTQHKK